MQTFEERITNLEIFQAVKIAIRPAGSLASNTEK